MLMKTILCFVPQEYVANMEQHGLQQIVSDVNDILHHIEMEVVVQSDLTDGPYFVCANQFEDENALRVQFTIQLDAHIFPLQQETRINILDGELYFYQTKIAPIPLNKRLANIYHQHQELQAAFEADTRNIDVWKELKKVCKEKQLAESRAVNTLTEIARIPMEMMEPIVNGEDTTSVYAHLFHIAMQEEETADVDSLYEEAIQQLENGTVENRIKILLSYGNYLHDCNKEEILIPYSKILQLYGADQPTEIEQISITARIMGRVGLQMRNENDTDTALTYLQGALALRSELAKINPNNYLSYEASCHWNLYLLYSDMDNEKLARYHTLKFYEISVALFDKYPPAYLVDLADAVESIEAVFGEDSQEYQDALNKLFDAITDKLPYSSVYNIRQIALAHWKLGKQQENAGMKIFAQQFYLIGRNLVEKAFKQNPLYAGDALLVLLYYLGQIHDELDKYEDTQTFYERHIEIACCFLQCGSDEYLAPLEIVLDEYDTLIVKRTKDYAAQFALYKVVVDVLQACEKRDSDTYLSALAARAFQLVTNNGYEDHKQEIRSQYAPIAYETMKKCEKQDGEDRSSSIGMMADLIGIHHFEHKQYEEAERWLKEAIYYYQKAEATDDDIDMVAFFAEETNYRLGLIYRNAHRHEEAEKAFTEAVRYAKLPEKELQQIILSLYGLADALREQNKDDAAKDAYLEMLRAADRHESNNNINEIEDNLQVLRGTAYSWLATYYGKIGQDELAEDCYHKAVALLEEEDATELKGESDDEYWARVKPETLDEFARDAFTKAYELAKEAKRQEAIPLFLRAIELWLIAKERCNHVPIYNLGVAYIQLAHLYMLEENDAESIACYRNAIAEWEQEIEENPQAHKNTFINVVDAYKGLAAVCYRQKRNEEVKEAALNCVKAFMRAQHHDCDLPIKPLREVLSNVAELDEDINIEDNIYTFALRQLNELQQNTAAYKWDYAIVCKDYGDALGNHNQREKACEMYQATIAIYGTANEQEKDLYAARIAECYAAMAITEHILQHYQAAYDSYVETCQRYQALSQIAPHQYLPPLAYYTLQVGKLLQTCNMKENALSAYKEALRIFQQVNDKENGTFDGYIAEAQQALKSLE